MQTIGLVANIFNEINALPGWLETHLPFFDDVRVTHAGPQGSYSTDGTIELLEKWRIPIDFYTIDGGFGIVRTRAIRQSPCDYVMLLDADERFFPVHRTLTCFGESTPQSEVDWILQSYDYHGVNLPNWENVNKLGSKLQVETGSPYNQGKRLRDWLEEQKPDAVCTSRRHWHDFSFRRPTQNWLTDPDWQLRIVKNDVGICYDPNIRIHERLVGARHILRPLPGMLESNLLYFDHFHFTFKRMEPDQRRHDIKIYDAIHKGEVPPR
jgi:glycosyltransferase involved in cell wall biosynthesis